MKRILKMMGLILSYLGTYMIMQFIAGYIILIALIFKQVLYTKSFQLQSSDIENLISQNTSKIILISIILSLIVYILIFSLEKKNIFKECKFKIISIKKIAAIALLGFGVNMIIDGILNFVPVDTWFPSHNQVINSIMGGNNFILTFLTVGIFVPIFEEILMRGLVFNELRRNMNLNLAIILQALIFGIYHFNMLQFIYASILGIFLGIAYVWTDSLWASILIHMIFNSSSLIMSKLLINVNILVYMLIGILVFFIGLKHLYRLTHVNQYN
ncbi:CPBP family intramembrane glutamic endopeptidase [Clostridium prolinivorans]|uniref:CPBP family intramembrane glutamic endopeptidase n=1 Tax=Clostridium prolinivorans TaxID=2769420 RepID=UPI000FDAA763|nr:CPBP family intramembrane glutamic endopeptidase [Clostridium prolinivorans]